MICLFYRNTRAMSLKFCTACFHDQNTLTHLHPRKSNRISIFSVVYDKTIRFAFTKGFADSVTARKPTHSMMARTHGSREQYIYRTKTNSKCSMHNTHVIFMFCQFVSEKNPSFRLRHAIFFISIRDDKRRLRLKRYTRSIAYTSTCSHKSLADVLIFTT